MLDFYKTIGGRQLFDSTIPRIATALEQIAKALTVEKEEPKTPQLTHEELMNRHKEMTRENGIHEADRWLAAWTDTRVASRILNVRRGLKRGAELVKAYNSQVLPSVPIQAQREIQQHVAAWIEKQADTYGDQA